MAGYELQAWLLRTWRTEVAKLTQSQAADAVHVTKSVISMWENADRGLTFDHLYALDRCYNASGALADIALAMGTPSGLPPHTSWVHNPQGDSGPVWAWCRPQPGREQIRVRVRWGAFVYQCSSPCSDLGIFLTSPVSMPNPPAWVDLYEPGWVDFGRGEIPEELGIPTFDAPSGLRVATDGQSPAGLVAPQLVERFKADPVFAEAVLDFFGEPRKVVRTVFSVADARKTFQDCTNNRPPTNTCEPFGGSQWRHLRDARCLSRRAAAELATALMPDHRVADEQIETLEEGGNPQARFMRPRLDRVYRADGYTGTEVVRDTNSRPFTFEFPNWWIGPVWFCFASTETSPAQAELRWGHNCKRLQVKDGITATCRKPTEEPIPFEVYCPSAWTVTAGMGMHSDARDANWGWYNLDDYTSREDDHVHELFLGLFGRTKEEFSDFLRRVR